MMTVLAVIHFAVIVPISLYFMLKESRNSWRNIMQRMDEVEGCQQETK